MYSRFNSAGILTTVDNSEVNIDGNVDFRIYGMVLQQMQQGAEYLLAEAV